MYFYFDACSLANNYIMLNLLTKKLCDKYFNIIYLLGLTLVQLILLLGGHINVSLLLLKFEWKEHWNYSSNCVDLKGSASKKSIKNACSMHN